MESLALVANTSRRLLIGTGVGARSAVRLTWPFLLWLTVFYLGWLSLVVYGDHWATLGEHWGIALAMALGSYVAGSTPMGGGTIGFPVLVLLFGEPASLGRQFSFAVQSIGMVSASIFILTMRRQIAGRLLLWAMLGSLVGTPLGIAFIAPRVDDLVIKLIFAVMWASFGLMHLVKVRDIVAINGITPSSAQFDATMGLSIGLLGGMTVAGVTGVGIDLVVYTLLILVARADVKIAIPTSIILMAFTSLVGVATMVTLQWANPQTHSIDAAVYTNWLAAAPVVAIGAPFGALMVYLIPRAPTLVFVSVLCIGQFIWTCVNEQVSLTVLILAVGGVLGFNFVFHHLHRWGERRVEPR